MEHAMHPASKKPTEHFMPETQALNAEHKAHAFALRPLSTALHLLFSVSRRDIRTSELRLLVIALVLAVASVTAVDFLSARLKLAMEREAGQLQGADLVLRSDREIREEVEREAARQGLAQARTVSFPSMVIARGENEARASEEKTRQARLALAEIKAVASAYPLRGQLRLSETPGGEGAVHRGAPESGAVWMEPRLARELRVGLGDEIQLGERHFRLAAYILLEPDRDMNFVALSPRLMLNLADLPATGLTQEGARLQWRHLFAGEQESIARFSTWLSEHLARGERMEEEGRQGTRRALRQGERFFGLASLLTVILAAVAIALSVRRFIACRLDAVALLRALGASRAQTLCVYLGELLLLGALASLAGSMLGYLLHFALYRLLAEPLGIDLPAPGILPFLQGTSLGILLLLAFALPPLVRLREVSPLRVLRRELGLPSFAFGLSYCLGFAALTGMIFWLADDFTLGATVLFAFLIALLAFLFLARGVLHLLFRFLRPSRWRYIVATLERHAWTSSLNIAALALGIMALLLLTVIRGELTRAWQHAAPPDAPNRFVLNIQEAQRADFAARLAAAGLEADIAPMIRGRLTHLNGQTLDASRYPGDERAQRLVERQFNLSWRAGLPEWNRLAAGEWFSARPDLPAQASVEEELARTLGVRLGDTLTFDLGSRAREVRVTSLRSLEWDSMRINFFVLLSPGVIDDAPASYLANFYLPDEKIALLDGIIEDFPNLTVFDISTLLAQARALIAQVSRAVELLFLLTLAAGLAVLHGALITTMEERRASLRILRILGASRKQILSAFSFELSGNGLIAGLIAGTGALIAGEALAWKLFATHLATLAWLPFATACLGAILTLLAGIRRTADGKLP
jgi:putative ABC transport system permease protein